MESEDQMQSERGETKSGGGIVPIVESKHWACCCNISGSNLLCYDETTKINTGISQVGFHSIRWSNTVMSIAQLNWVHSDNITGLSDCCVESSSNSANGRSKDAIGSFYGMLYETMFEDLDTCSAGEEMKLETGAKSMDWGDYFRLVEFLVGEMSTNDCESTD